MSTTTKRRKLQPGDSGWDDRQIDRAEELATVTGGLITVEYDPTAGRCKRDEGHFFNAHGDFEKFAPFGFCGLFIDGRKNLAEQLRDQLYQLADQLRDLGDTVAATIPGAIRLVGVDAVDAEFPPLKIAIYKDGKFERIHETTDPRGAFLRGYLEAFNRPGRGDGRTAAYVADDQKGGAK